MKTIPNNIFIKLMENLKCTSGEELDTVGFESDYNKWHMNFHGTMEGGYELQEESFGRMHIGKWEQMETTEGQRLKMQNAILTKVEEITGENDRIGYIDDDLNYGIYGRFY